MVVGADALVYHLQIVVNFQRKHVHWTFRRAVAVGLGGEKVPSGCIGLAQQDDGKQSLDCQFLVQHFPDRFCFQPPVSGTVVGNLHMVEKIHNAIRWCPQLNETNQIVKVCSHIGELFISLFIRLCKKFKCK